MLNIVLIHISPRGGFSPRYKVPCIVVRNARFTLLLNQTSIKVTNNTINAQIVISSVYFLLIQKPWDLFRELYLGQIWD